MNCLKRTDYQFGQFNSNNTDNSFEIGQSIPFPTYYSARSGLFNAEYKNSLLKQQETANEIKAQVHLHYYQLQYLKNAKLKLMQLDSLYSDFVNVATLRFNTGETNLLEKITAETRRNEITILFKNKQKAIIQQAYYSLKNLIYSNEDFEVNDVFEPIVLTYCFRLFRDTSESFTANDVPTGIDSRKEYKTGNSTNTS